MDDSSDSALEEQVRALVSSGSIVDGSLPVFSRARPGEYPQLAASVLRKLVFDCSSGALKAPKGIWIYHFDIVGELDLEGATLNAPFYMERCQFKDRVIFRSTRLFLLGLEGSVFEKIVDARDMHLEAHLFCRLGFVAKRPFLLRDARIAGTLDLTGATFLAVFPYADPDNYVEEVEAYGEALSLTRARIGELNLQKLARAPVNLVLRNARTDYLRVGLDEPEAFEKLPAAGNLILEGFSYRLKDPSTFINSVRFVELNPGFSATAYNYLSKALANAGLTQQAEDVLAILRKHELPTIHSPVRRIFLSAFYALTSYGRSPEGAILALLLLLLAFSGASALAYQYGAIEPADLEVRASSCYIDPTACETNQVWSPIVIAGEQRFMPAGYRDFSAPLYAAESFLPILDFGQRAAWRPCNVIADAGLAALRMFGMLAAAVAAAAATGLTAPRSRPNGEG